MSIDRGDSLFSLSIVLAILLIAAPIGYQRYADFMQLKEWDVTIAQTNTFSFSAKRYVKDHYNALQTQLLSQQLVVIDGSVLQAQGYLPSGYRLINNQGQYYQLVIAPASSENSGLLSLLISQGGTPIPFKGLRYIAESLEGSGGYIYNTDLATGAQGEWQLDLQKMGIGNGRGHIVNYLSAAMPGTIKAESDRLYRYSVNGRPDLNQMHTAIDMADNDINHAKRIHAQTGLFDGNIAGQRLVARQAVWSDGNIMAQGDVRSDGGWIITKNNKGWINVDHKGGFYMDDDQWVKSYKGKGIYTQGEMRAGTINAEGRMSTSEFMFIKGQATGNNPCSDNGLLASSDDGTLLVCQQGRWQATAKNSGQYVRIGNISGVYDGLNNGNGTQWIIASGGNAISAAAIGQGNCQNTSELSARVNGMLIAESSNDNLLAHSSNTLSFPVPPNTRYQVQSSPGKKYGCGNGRFSLMVYQ